ncbi:MULTISPECIES: RnfABCDGE type electron transport complex subunit B [Tissierellales]|jgi:RnfABCDGE-type electron transport complex B subunit|uniref:RnfABCDGE type electron transport complex subunit B n=1 Tax=Acidilutibacter cellobiosedens TaxID=2507161 RepID=A0A410QD25_9FIRM|nr:MULTISPECIES: RnfABCDGE type electron transport complex subunit B [Tissierellales]QAT61829.1 RnfABCDGE type electron transport complex subunit B [Acidilutibacter cellobiosedens]SCL81979.1 Nitrogen fixation protein rnfB [Sporanaerobacter sp. PP17-6a]
MSTILLPVAVLGSLGLIFGIGLSLASKAFEVKIDPRIEAIKKCLPGVNCGACGYPGCEGLASAIVEEKASIDGCKVGGKPVAEKIKNIMEG